MIDVDLLSVIRRWHRRDELSIREISRRTGLSRHTIRKYLNSEEVVPKYPPRQSSSKLDPFAATLEEWLLRESRRPRKRRRTVKQLYRDLEPLGYSGSYDRVAAFARNWRQRRAEAANRARRGTYVPLQFDPGEAFQFDWSEDWVHVAGRKTKFQVAHFKLCHSRAFMMRCYPLQTHEMLFDAHNHCLAALGGIPRRGIYDNMKTAVDKVGRGKQRQVNVRFRAMASHFLFETDFCNAAAGWEKGQVEKNVRDARHRIWQDEPKFADLVTLNAWLEQRCKALWQEIRHPEQSDRTVAEVWAEEKAYLGEMPPPFDGCVEHHKRVSPTCLVVFERNRYSVPAALANQVIGLRVYADRLVMVAHSAIVAEHQRVFTRNHSGPARTVYDWRHYLSVVQRKPGALRNGAPFTTLPESLRTLQGILLKQPGGDREMADILALVLQYDEALVVKAAQQAIDDGVPTKTHVLNRLSRLLDADSPAVLEPPPALAVQDEPIANTERYDHLREARHGE